MKESKGYKYAQVHVGLEEKEEKFDEFVEETHSHNVYRKDKHHLKLGTGL